MEHEVHYRVNRLKVIFEAFDDEIVLINQDNGTYYTLVSVGAHIWNLIQKELSFKEIVNEVICSYTGNVNNIESAIDQFLNDLQKEDLIELTSVERGNNVEALATHFTNDNKTDKPVFEAPTILRYTDMQDLLLLDPIHEVDETGWPTPKKGTVFKK